MTRILWTSAAALGLALGVASAARADVADQVVGQLRDQGFTHVEVVKGPTQVKIEGIRGTQQVEYVYDLRTGELLSREVGRVRPGEDRTPRVEFDRSDRDFVDDRGGDDDGDGHDMNDDGNNGHGNDDESFDDSNPGRGHGDDGVVGGGRGHDDRGHDDHGNDDHGDDHGGHGNGHGHDDHGDD